MGEMKDLKKFKEEMAKRGFLPAFAQAVLEIAQAADAVEVVRCKDCIKRYDTDECPMCFLSRGQYCEFTQDDGFCDRGERKEE